MRKGIAAALLISWLAATAESQERQVNGDEQQIMLTGNLRVDFFGKSELANKLQSDGKTDATNSVPYKSPWLAAGLSLALPGAGEFYAESYWKAAAFFAIEVAAWTVAYSFDRKGDKKTDFFQAFANQHWSVRKYAEWSLENARNINPAVDPLQYNVLEGSGVNWAELNKLERAIGNWYSHTLPPFGDQQYYELIGKYQQFYQGWDDADPSLQTYAAIDARLSAGNALLTFYAGERGKANDYYNVASTGVTIAVINHILSAIDAAWSASSFNGVHAKVGIQKVPRGDTFVSVPVVKFSYSF